MASPAQELNQTNGNVDPLSDQFWSPTAIAAGDLVDMTLAEEEKAWAMSHERQIRMAGHRGTDEGRRGILDQHGHGVREIEFRGRYQGPAKISARLIAASEGEEVAAILP